MPNRRHLALRRELLAELSRADAARVAAGASGLPCLSVPDCASRPYCATLEDCWSLACTNGPCASDFHQCTTAP